MWPIIWQQLAVMIGAGLSVEKALQTSLKSEPKTTAERNINLVLGRVYGLVQRS